MTPHLLIISIGPIQDFIASARRCQDLWFGSWLLSDLARSVAESVKKSAPSEDPLIFPAGLDEQEKPAVANKILAILSAALEPKIVAQQAHAAMKARLDQVSGAAFKRVDGVHFDGKLAEAQLDDLMEFIWVAVPLIDTAGGYATARDKAVELLSARKNTHVWGGVPWHTLAGAGVPKSSLDGLRESVINERAYNLNPALLRKQYFVKPGERLCGVGLLKRLGADPDFDNDNRLVGTRRPVFHSTSHVTSAPILSRIAHKGAAGTKALSTYLDELNRLGVDLSRFAIQAGGRKESEASDPRDVAAKVVRVPRTLHSPRGERNGVGLDGYLLFEGRLREIVWEFNSQPELTPDPSAVDEARTALAKFRQALDLNEGHTAYYAYLLADGDAMGKAIDALAKLPDGIDRHRQLGKAMEKFSSACRDQVEKAGGSLVYAGGDDVLALCPLHTVLALARELRDSFQKNVEPVFRNLADVPVPTLSVGLGISHHMESMDHARKLAKQAERLAKESGRNALALVIAKRSGGTTTVVRRWCDTDESLDRWLVKICCWLGSGDLPDGLAFDLHRLLAPFEMTFGEKADPAKVAEAVLALAQGIVGRKRSGGGNSELPPALAARLQKELQGKNSKDAVARLSDEIQVARLFKTAFDDAFGPLPRESVG